MLWELVVIRLVYDCPKQNEAIKRRNINIKFIFFIIPNNGRIINEQKLVHRTISSSTFWMLHYSLHVVNLLVILEIICEKDLFEYTKNQPIKLLFSIEVVLK